MTLKEFATKAGVEVFECEPGYGGKYGYKEKEFPSASMLGFRSERLATKTGWQLSSGSRQRRLY